MSTAFLFPGQGSQYPGMAREFAEIYPKFAEIFVTAKEILGFDLKDACYNGTPEELSKTIIAQPAIMAASIICCEAAKARGLNFTAVAGHSLGEYAAMVVSGMLTLEDGFKVIKARAEAMEKASRIKPGAMAAVVGITSDEVESICTTLNDYVVPVNYNSPTQTVIAGTIEGIDRAVEKFTKEGAKVIRLNVSAAFHSKLMQSAADDFMHEIRNVKFKTPKCKFYSNIYGGELHNFEHMPELLAKHMVSPVLFTSELETLYGDGYETFVECGPGKVLTGLVKKTIKGANAYNVENTETLQHVLNVIEE